MAENGFDALMPLEVAKRAEGVGERKAQLDTLSTLLLAVLAGAFIAAGAVFSTTAAAGTGSLPFGIGRLLAGLAFCLGLILVVVAGAELFTGNTLIVMAWASRRISTLALLRNWGLAYVGNFIGALATAGLVFVARQYQNGGGVVGQMALQTAERKCALGFVQAIALGILCNALVVSAVWLTMSGRSTTDKIMAIIFPISAFVATGFEHSIANMYFIPIGLLIKTDAAFMAKAAAAGVTTPHLSVANFLIGNLLPVTIGNIIGGSIMVGLMYWLAYLRPHSVLGTAAH
jgi:formate transporter